MEKRKKRFTCNIQYMKIAGGLDRSEYSFAIHYRTVLFNVIVPV